MSPIMRTVITRCSRWRVLSSPVISWASCWLRVVMSPAAETSTNKGESTSSRLYWSRWLMASDQASSIFWNSLDLRAFGRGDGRLGRGRAGAEAGFCASGKQHESRKTEKPATRRVIRTMNSSDQGSGIRGQLPLVPKASVRGTDPSSLICYLLMIAPGLGQPGRGKH